MNWSARLQAGRRLRIPSGQVLLHSGDTVAQAYLLQAGVIKVHDIDRQNRHKILHLLKPPALLPFAVFSEPGSKTRWNYTALTDCSVSPMPVEQLRAQLAADGQLTVTVLQWFSHEVHELLARLSSIGKSNTQNKIIAVLYFLSAHHGAAAGDGWHTVNFSINHQLLADMAGVSRESVTMCFPLLVDQKLIRRTASSIEINHAKLQQLAARRMP